MHRGAGDSRPGEHRVMRRTICLRKVTQGAGRAPQTAREPVHVVGGDPRAPAGIYLRPASKEPLDRDRCAARHFLFDGSGRHRTAATSKGCGRPRSHLRRGMPPKTGRPA